MSDRKADGKIILSEAALGNVDGIVSTAVLTEPATAAESKKALTLVLKRSGVEFEQKSVTIAEGYEHAGYRYVSQDGFQYYFAIAEGEGSKKRVKGYRSKLIVEKDDGTSGEYDCIERANGFRHLKSGSHTATMILRDSQKVLQISGDIIIHAACYPFQLEGCIAPGKEWEEYGVLDSGPTLANIIGALGKWQLNKTFELEIRGEKTTAG